MNDSKWEAACAIGVDHFGYMGLGMWVTRLQLAVIGNP